jgi:hypothetical protein
MTSCGRKAGVGETVGVGVAVEETPTTFDQAIGKVMVKFSW